MLNKSFWIHTSFKCLCVLSSSLSCAAIAQAQAQPRPTQVPAGTPAAQAGGTKVQGKQLQQMFQAQSAQNQAQANAKSFAGQAQPGQAPQAQAAQAQAAQTQAGQMQPGPMRPGQPVMQQQAGQQFNQQPGQQPGQQAVQQPGQVPNGQAQNVAGQPNNGQNPVGVPLTPQQAAAIAAAQQQALAGGGVNPVPPFGPLTKEWEVFLDQVLTRWEAESSKVEKFQCEFVRFQYNPTQVAPDHFTVAKGELKYLKPDKGLLKVNVIQYYAGKDDKGQAKYEINAKREFGEYWTCDGENIYDLNRNEKVCTIFELPPNMRGAGIQASPLPFVFGVKKQDLLARYWIKPLPQPKERPNEIWLEVYPRRADDASNYQKLQVVLDLKDWMPMGLIVFLNNWTPQSPHRELYQFEKRVVNATNILPQIFQKEFIPAKPPADWKVIKERAEEPQAQQPADQPRVAQPPQAGVPVR